MNFALSMKPLAFVILTLKCKKWYSTNLFLIRESRIHTQQQFLWGSLGSFLNKSEEIPGHTNVVPGKYNSNYYILKSQQVIQ